MSLGQFNILDREPSLLIHTHAVLLKKEPYKNVIHNYDARHGRPQLEAFGQEIEFKINDKVICQSETFFAKTIRRNIEKLPVVLSNFRRRQNTFLPISALAPEIMIEIFQFAIYACNGHRQKLHSASKSLRISSQVCWLWREIAIRCPSLWRMAINYEVDHPDWVVEMLKRTQQAPLSVRVDFRSIALYEDGKKARSIAWVSRNLFGALDHLARVKVLSINGPRTIFDDVVRLLGGSVAPKLSTLYFTFDQGHPSDMYDLGDFLLNQFRTPALIRIRLRNFRGVLKTALPATITHLELLNVSANTYRNTQDLLLMLTHLPNLENLVLHYVLRDIHSTERMEPIRMPQIRYLDIRAHVEDAHRFLGYVSLPHDVFLKVQGFSTDPIQDGYHLLLRISEHLGDALIHGLMMSSDGCDFALQCTESNHSNNWSIHSARAKVDVYFFWTQAQGKPVTSLVELTCTMLPVKRTKELRISFPAWVDIESSAWSSALGGLMQVEHMTVTNGPLQILFNSLMPVREEMILPALRAITCDLVDFGYLPLNQGPRLAAVLAKFLNSRRKFLARIQNLGLVSCFDFTDTDLGQLTSEIGDGLRITSHAQQRK